MTKSKTPFKTNVNQSISPEEVKQIRKARRAREELEAQKRPLRVYRVNLEKEKSNRNNWILKWVLLLPLCLYLLSWFLLLLIDFFKA